MSNCSVIIVNYNTGVMLNDVVAAVLANQQVTEIIVVDNNSKDNSMELLEQHAIVKKHYRQTNHGFAVSCNYGAKIASNEYLLFLNPDCLVKKSSIDKLLVELNNHQDVAIIGTRVNNPDGSEQRASRRRLPTFWQVIKTYTKIEKLAKLCNCFAGVNLNHQPMPNNIQQVEAISGAFILMRTSVFEQINGFDEKFPLHFEDLDLFKRTIQAGYKILFNPNIAVVHHQGLSSKSNPKVASLKKQGLIRYFQKHNSSISYMLIKIFAKVI